MNWLVGWRRSHLLKFFAILASLLLLLTPVSFAVQVQYLYDANGNLVSDGVYCYSYNDANQLSEVRNCSNSKLISEYFYDHSGQRSVKRQYDSGVLQYTIYYVSRLFESKIYPNGTVENTSYYFVNGERVARRDKDGVTYYHSDHLGSASVLTDEAGDLVEEIQYYPFGSVRAGGTQSKFLYTGQESDPETGLYYYGARYYNPELKRFAQADPIIQNIYDPQSLNRYSYVRNNPLKYTDPSGHAVPVLLLTGLAGAGIGGAVGFWGSAISQVWNKGSVDWGEAAESGVTGAVAGGIFGLTLGVGTAVIGGLELTGAAAVGTEATFVAVGGAGSGQIARTTDNVFEGEEVHKIGDAGDMVCDAGTALIFWGAGKGVSSAFSNKGQKFNRYVTESELNAIDEKGMLRGGKAGETYFTKDVYGDSLTAQQKLSLPKPPSPE